MSEYVQVTHDIEITPEILAKSFWRMDSEEQCMFFEALGKEIGDDTHSAQMQWFFLEQSLRKNDLAKDTFMDMAAPMFWSTLKYMESQ